MRTRGACSCVLKTPTGLPDCTSKVSSFSRFFRLSTIARYAFQLRAARPVPPYTTRSCGRSATSESRLFMSMRMAASCCQPLQVIWLPRGARIEVEDWVNDSTGMNSWYWVCDGQDKLLLRTGGNGIWKLHLPGVNVTSRTEGFIFMND